MTRGLLVMKDHLDKILAADSYRHPRGAVIWVRLDPDVVAKLDLITEP